MTNTKKLPDTELALTGNLTACECATVLAALRVFQAIAFGGAALTVTDATKCPADWNGLYGGNIAKKMEHFTDGDKPLSPKQIDALCARINLQPVQVLDEMPEIEPAPANCPTCENSRYVPHPTQEDQSTPCPDCTQSTPERQQYYVASRGVVCPFCKSTDISGGSFDVSDGVAWQPISCGDCGRDWQDTYRLTGFELQ